MYKLFFSCEGVNYNRRNGDCALFEQVHGVGEKDDHVDFYANLCLVNEVDTGVSSAINVPKEQQFVSVAAASSKTDAKGAASIDKSEGGSRSSLLTSGAEKVTFCEEVFVCGISHGNSFLCLL